LRGTPRRRRRSTAKPVKQSRGTWITTQRGTTARLQRSRTRAHARARTHAADAATTRAPVPLASLFAQNCQRRHTQHKRRLPSQTHPTSLAQSVRTASPCDRTWTLPSKSGSESRPATCSRGCEASRACNNSQHGHAVRTARHARA
jgi:hypothetical protein